MLDLFFYYTFYLLGWRTQRTPAAYGRGEVVRVRPPRGRTWAARRARIVDRWRTRLQDAFHAVRRRRSFLLSPSSLLARRILAVRRPISADHLHDSSVHFLPLLAAWPPPDRNEIPSLSSLTARNMPPHRNCLAYMSKRRRQQSYAILFSFRLK